MILKFKYDQFFSMWMLTHFISQKVKVLPLAPSPMILLSLSPSYAPLIPALTHQNDELLLYADLSPSDESHILLTPLHVDETETDEDIFYVCVCGVFMLGWSVNLWHGKISFVVGRKCPSFYQDQKSFWRNSLETGGHMT